MRFCTSCGNKAPTGALFCPNCGHKLPVPQDITGSTLPEQGSCTPPPLSDDPGRHGAQDGEPLAPDSPPLQDPQASPYSWYPNEGPNAGRQSPYGRQPENNRQPGSGYQTPYNQPPYGERQNPYYPPPHVQVNDRAPSRMAMAIAIIGLIMSFFINSTLCYPVIAIGLWMANKELEEGKTTQTTARIIGVVALIIAIVWHIFSLMLMISGV